MTSRDRTTTHPVSGAYYFHINSTANLSPHAVMRRGDTIDVGASNNPFFRFYEVHQRTYTVTEAPTGAVHNVPAMKFLRLVRDRTVKTDGLPAIAVETANHFLMLARELLWENVRLAEFPDAPSRQRCIWLVDSLTHVKSWIERLGFASGCYSVVRVRAHGRALHVDGNNLAGDSEPLPVWYEKARAYWRGEASANPIPEVLFEGRIEVEEIIDPLQLTAS